MPSKTGKPPVQVAVHRETGEKVAVKTFTRKQLCRKGVVDMIRETKIHASFDHPNIVKAATLNPKPCPNRRLGVRAQSDQTPNQGVDCSF